MVVALSPLELGKTRAKMALLPLDRTLLAIQTQRLHDVVRDNALQIISSLAEQHSISALLGRCNCLCCGNENALPPIKHNLKIA